MSRPAKPKSTQRASRGHERARLRSEAENHRHTRRAHLSELAEDYVEAIAELISLSGEARAADIARRFGVTHVTVSKTVARLQRAGLVTTQPYRSIFLTEEGRRLADQARRRHEIVVRFLQSIGVNEETARTDAEGIEHHVSEETLAAFQRFCVRKP
jgi:DtxR family manganese transport transcriptional regulator